MPKNKLNPYAGMKSGILASGAIARKATRSEFRFTQDALASIYGNLGTTLGGGTAALNAEQRRLVGAVQAGRTDLRRKSTRVSNEAKGNISRLYGSAALGSTTGGAGKGGSLDKMYQTAESGMKVMNSKLAAGGIVARGNSAAMNTLAQGAEMAQAGADAQLADALAYRAKNDATLQASALLELQKMRLQNKLDIQNYKAKLALEDEAEGGISNASAVAGSAADSAQTLFGYMGNVQADGSPAVGAITRDDQGILHDEAGNVITPMDATTAANTYIQKFGVTDENEQSVIYSISRALYTRGAGQAEGKFTGTPEDLASVVSERLTFLYPDLSKKQVANVQGLLTASFADVGPVSPAGATGAGEAGGGADAYVTDTFNSGFVKGLANALPGGNVVLGGINALTGGIKSVTPAQVSEMARKNGVDYNTMKDMLAQQGYSVR